MFDWYQGRSVLVTGHTGFKGSWLCAWLRKCGARVAGFSLDVPTNPALFDVLELQRHVQHRAGDVRDPSALQKVLPQEQPEIVFHLAAQPLVRRSLAAPRETFDTNVTGLVNLLEAVRQTPSVRAVVIVTSDKCYSDCGSDLAHSEEDALGGRDPYSASKACAELVVNAYRESLLSGGAALATARAGNVLGGGDWAADRIVPDCIRALVEGRPIELRRPDAVRPWQHVLEPLAGYLLLGERLVEQPEKYAGAWNFGPDPESCCTVGELVDEIVRAWGSGTWLSRPDPQASLETGRLLLSSEKARLFLGWNPVWSLDATVERTVDWYRGYHDEREPAQLAIRQIEEYEADMARPMLSATSSGYVTTGSGRFRLAV